MALVRITGSTDGIGRAAARSFSGRATGYGARPHRRARRACGSARLDPGWVKTKLASPGTPGDVRSGGARPALLSGALTSPRLQDELLTAMDWLAGSTG